MHRINVTEPHLPNRTEFDRIVDAIWERNWLTNNGPTALQLEREVSSFLDVPSFSFVTNGTIALELALEALKITGEVLTTSFSFVATASSIAWQKLSPRLVDVDPDTLNIDPALVERSITSRTQAILATHVYGNPCDVFELERIAQKYGLVVIYDGAHAFGCRYRGRSLLSYGNISTVSFHATKLFHTVEGGGVIARDAEIGKLVNEMRNFGLKDDGSVELVGTNAKNSEFHAAMGLANLREFDAILQQRRLISRVYDEKFEKAPLRRPILPDQFTYNYAYYPVLFQSETALLRALRALNAEKIFPRRYFYPSLSSLNYVDAGLGTPVSDELAHHVLCLPLHTRMTLDDAARISDLLVKSLGMHKERTRSRYAMAGVEIHASPM